MRSAEAILQRVAADEPLDPSLGYQISNPARVREVLGSSLLYAQPVEAEVAFSRAVAHTVVPNMDPLLNDFFDVWEPQELRHGEIEANALEIIGLTPAPPVEKVTFGLRLAGKLAAVSPGFHDVAEAVVVAYAGLGEKEVTIAYPSMAHQARRIGETALAEEVLQPIIKQEAAHLSFYDALAQEKWAKLKDWQRRAVRKIVEVGYHPVGVQGGNLERMRSFAGMLLALEPDDPMGVAKRVEVFAAKILHTTYEDGAFVKVRYQECLDAIKG